MHYAIGRSSGGMPQLPRACRARRCCLRSFALFLRQRLTSITGKAISAFYNAASRTCSESGLQRVRCSIVLSCLPALSLFCCSLSATMLLTCLITILDTLSRATACSPQGTHSSHSIWQAAHVPGMLRKALLLSPVQAAQMLDEFDIEGVYPIYKQIMARGDKIPPAVEAGPCLPRPAPTV